MSNNSLIATQNAVVTAGFNTTEGFALIQRVAKVFSTSNMVPKDYQGEKNIGNCIIAINMAQRLHVDPLTVMQNLNVINGRPSWSTQFLISMFNACGRFAPIRYQPTGEKGTDSQGCIAYTYEKATGDRIDGEEVNIAMAKAEGWTRNVKWKNLAGLMLRYRAATVLIRTTAPELCLGLGTQEEAVDIANSQLQQPHIPQQNVDIDTGEIVNAEGTTTTTTDFEALANVPELAEAEDIPPLDI